MEREQKREREEAEREQRDGVDEGTKKKQNGFSEEESVRTRNRFEVRT